MPHINELYDYVVTVFIVYDNKVLLVHHPRYGKWIPPGGHVELNENPEEALFREVQEETGLDVTVLSQRPGYEDRGVTPLLTPHYIDAHEANAPHKHIAFVYFARATSAEYVLSEEHTEMRWFSEAELTENTYGLTSSIIFYAQEALKTARQE